MLSGFCGRCSRRIGCRRSGSPRATGSTTCGCPASSTGVPSSFRESTRTGLLLCRAASRSFRHRGTQKKNRGSQKRKELGGKKARVFRHRGAQKKNRRSQKNGNPEQKPIRMFRRGEREEA